MLLPPYGVCLPVAFLRGVLDPTLVLVQLHGYRPHLAVRLVGVMGPDDGTAQEAATSFLTALLEDAHGSLSLWLPPPRRLGKLLRGLRGNGRVIGQIYIGTELTASEALIHAGHGRPAEPVSPRSGRRKRVPRRRGAGESA